MVSVSFTPASASATLVVWVSSTPAPGFGLAHPGGGLAFAHPSEGYGLGQFDRSFGGQRFGGSPYHGGYDRGGESFYRGYAYRAAPLYGGYDYGGQSYYGGQAYYGDNNDDSDGSNYTDTSARGRRSGRAAAYR